MIRRLARSSRDPLTRGRTFWFSVCALVDAALVGVGSGYALRGSGASVYPGGFRVLRHLVPLGLYGHGWVMVTLGLLNLWNLARLSQRYERASWAIVRRTGKAILFYCSLVALCLLGGCWLNERYDADFWWYLVLAMVAAATVSLPPDFDKDRVRTDRA